MPITLGPVLSSVIEEERTAAHAIPVHQESSSNVTTAASFTEIFSYTATANDTRILQIESTAGTFGHYKVKIEGLTKRELRTTGSNPNAMFLFIEPQTLATGESITVEFQPFRLRAASQDTFVALEGYVGP